MNVNKALHCYIWKEVVKCLAKLLYTKSILERFWKEKRKGVCAGKCIREPIVEAAKFPMDQSGKSQQDPLQRKSSLWQQMEIHVCM